MTRREAAMKARDELCGLIADAHVAGRRGADLALRLRQDFARVEAILHDLLTTKEEHTLNGVEKPKERSK